VGGAVSAGTYLGGAYVPGAGDDYWAWYYATYYGGVSAGRDVTGPVTAGRSIVGVTAGRDVLGAVHAQGGDVWLVRAGGGGVYTEPPPESDPDGSPGEGGTFIPYDPGRVLGAVTAWRDVTSVIATGDVLGKVTAQAGFVFVVNADGSVLGGVEAATDIGQRTIREADADWRPYYWDPFTQHYWPETWAPLGVGVVAETGTSAAACATTGSIWGQVRAGRDVLLSEITAGQNIGTYSGDFDPSYEEYGSGVHAGRTMAAAVSAGIDVGAVSAGVLVSGNVTAGGTVGSVAARGGEIRGDVSAGEHIGWALRWGPPARGGDAGGADRRSDDLHRQRVGMAPAPAADAGGRRQHQRQSDRRRVDRHGAGVQVLDGDVSAGLTLELVWAADDITGDVSAGQGDLRVGTWSELSGNVAGSKT
jgi:hypothetical protein